MRFTVTTLRKAVDRAIAADKADHEKYQAKRLEQYETAKEKWLSEHSAEWTAALLKIRVALKKGKPVRMSDFPSAGEPGWSLRRTTAFDYSEPTSGAYSPDTQLVTIANALDLITDENISDAQLARLGVRSGTLRRLCELLPLESE